MLCHPDDLTDDMQLGLKQVLARFRHLEATPPTPLVRRHADRPSRRPSQFVHCGRPRPTICRNCIDSSEDLSATTPPSSTG
ncbi:hypothetical protein AXA44_07535 [Rhodococcus sp. SC4]|nr:hypothetical protein AXA44_07535 [Rhodococcus sp. SC4]